MTSTYTRTHTQIGFANPYLKCEECGSKVRYWHNPDRCGCDDDVPFFNYPCEHTAGVISTCPDWNPVDGCCCEETCKK